MGERNPLFARFPDDSLKGPEAAAAPGHQEADYGLSFIC